jgi:cytosine/adenosine deaminase-related metal-dependent hydrolase
MWPNVRFTMPTIVRAQVAHTPCNPLVFEDALETFPDGAVAFDRGRVVACGPFSEVRRRFPHAQVRDERDAVLAREAPDVLVTSHLNETAAQVESVAALFPWARDYMDTYERYGLVSARGAVFTLAPEESIAEVRVAGRVVG